jgi:hypothetical protein
MPRSRAMKVLVLALLVSFGTPGCVRAGFDGSEKPPPPDAAEDADAWRDGSLDDLAVGSDVGDAAPADSNADAQSGVKPPWATALGGPLTDLLYGVAIDGQGNVLVTGSFEGKVDFGGKQVVSQGMGDIFVAKLDPTGKVIWSWTAGGPGPDLGYDVTTDPKGYVYVTGYFSGTVTLTGQTMVSNGQQDLFVVKLDPAGKLVWAEAQGGISEDFGYALTVDGQGGVAVTGQYSGKVDFGGVIQTSNGAGDIFVMKLDAAGGLDWVQACGSTLEDRGWGVGLDAKGNVLATGVFRSKVDFGLGQVQSEGQVDIFVIKYGPSGKVSWVRTIGGTDFDGGDALAVDGQGNALITGHFQGSVDFGLGVKTSNGNHDIFVLKLDGAGKSVWVRTLGGTQIDWGAGVTVDSQGNALVTGLFAGMAELGLGQVTSNGVDDIFVLKLDGSGKSTWVETMGSPGNDVGRAVAADALGNAVIAGWFSSSMVAGGGAVSSAGKEDAFIVTLSP